MTATLDIETVNPHEDDPDPARVSNPADYYPVIARVIEHFNAKVPEYERAENFYRGNIEEVFAAEHIAQLLEDVGDDYLCNFAARVVDAVADRLEVQSVQVLSQADAATNPAASNNPSLADDASGAMGVSQPDLFSDPSPTTVSATHSAIIGGDAAGTGDEISTHANDPATNPTTPASGAPALDPGSEALNLLWRQITRRNHIANFLAKWIKKALVYGDSYALAWDDGADWVITQVLDPKTTCVLYDEQNEDLVTCGARWFEIEGEGGDKARPAKRINLYYNHWVVKFITKPHATGEKPEDYQPYIDPLDIIPDQADTSIESPAQQPFLTAYPWVNDMLGDTNGQVPLRIAAALGASVAARTPLGQPQPSTSASGLVSPADPAPGTWPVPNPHRQMPIKHLRTDDDECYGTPEHRAAYGPQNAINKLIATQMVTTDALGFPMRVALQKSGTIDENAFDDPEDDELPPDRHISTVEATPGTINLLKDVDALVQLAAADPDGFLKPMLNYVKFMSFTTSTPMSFYDTLGQMPSDSTQRENIGPLIKKCRKRKLNMGPAIESFVELLFSILGQNNVTVIVQWAQSQMVDDLAGWQVITGKLANGVPWDVVMQEAGYTEAEIATWPKPSTGFTALIAMVLQVAQAAQALAPAVEGTVMSAEQAQNLIGTMLEAIKNTPVDASSRANVSFRG